MVTKRRNLFYAGCCVVLVGLLAWIALMGVVLGWFGDVPLHDLMWPLAVGFPVAALVQAAGLLVAYLACRDRHA